MTNEIMSPATKTTLDELAQAGVSIGTSSWKYSGWDIYCRISFLARYPGEHVSVCGLIIAVRSHHQVTGGQMKLITICD